MDNLTQKQDMFARVYVELGNASEAYRQSYDATRMTPTQIWTEACTTKKIPKVARRIKELRKVQTEKLDAERFLTFEDRSEVLALIVTEELEADKGTVIKAVSELNKMHGGHSPKESIVTNIYDEMSPEQIEQKVLSDMPTLKTIFRRLGYELVPLQEVIEHEG